jgi:catechol 2,3-dioxygenase-like lactoylglutathione lyase family enzyme
MGDRFLEGKGAAPERWAALVPELLVSELVRSVRFWCDVLGFAVAYERPGFVYLTRGELQVMLCGRDGSWETGDMQPPFGRGINLQMVVPAIAPILVALEVAGWGLYQAPAEAWYEVGQREFLVQDPDGYLLRFAETI